MKVGDDSGDDASDGAQAPALRVDVDGYEGPLDLLLDLARRQKVDLARISVLALAEQFLAYIEEARRVRLELAADYLVMAAWLAYLKSRLLLPDPPKGEGPPAHELAAALAQRLARLEAIRKAAAKLMERPQLGRDVHARGAPETILTTRVARYEASLYDLLSAYARQRQKQAIDKVVVRRRATMTLAEARETLARLVEGAIDWTRLDVLLARYLDAPASRRTVAASTFAALLEMTREGACAIRQDRVFGPIWVSTQADGDAGDGERGEAPRRR